MLIQFHGIPTYKRNELVDAFGSRNIMIQSPNMIEFRLDNIIISNDPDEKTSLIISNGDPDHCVKIGSLEYTGIKLF